MIETPEKIRNKSERNNARVLGFTFPCYFTYGEKPFPLLGNGLSCPSISAAYLSQLSPSIYS
jgi:hypothetical protein